MKDRLKIVIFTLMIVLINISSASAATYQGVRSYLIGDYETGRILEGENIYDVVEIASISKVMSYMLVMDSGVEMSDLVKIDQDSLNIGGSLMKLELNKEYTVDELLNYSLVVSSNNAIYALAKYVSGTESAFVEKMNDKAKEIGLDTAKFYNSTGLPVKELDVQNVMSTNDIFKMSRYAIENYDILEKTSMEAIMGLDFWGEEKELKNTNPTIMLEGVDGLKTGHTNKAGYCLVSTFSNYLKEGRIISIFMGARTEGKREELSKKAIFDVNSKYSYEEILNKEKSLGMVNIPNSNRKNLDVFVLEDKSAIVDMSKDISYEIKLDERILFPVKKGNSFGQVLVYNGDEIVCSEDIKANKTIRKSNIINRFFGRIGSFFIGFSKL